MNTRSNAATDHDIVARVLQGEQDAYALLVERYHAMAHAVAFGQTGNRADADDLVQEAFIRAYEALNSLKQGNAFAPWLLRILRNRITDTRRRRSEAQAEEHAIEQYSAAPVDHGQEELRDLVYHHVLALDEVSREVILLYYYAATRTPEIARTLEISEEAVKKRLQRARQRLGEQLVAGLEPREDAAPRKAANLGAVMGAIAVMAIPVGNATAETPGILPRHDGFPWKLLGTGVAAVIILAGLVGLVQLRGEDKFAAGARADGRQETPASESPLTVSGEKRAGTVALAFESRDAAVDIVSADLPGVVEDAPEEEMGPGVIYGVVVHEDGTPVDGATVTLRSMKNFAWDEPDSAAGIEKETRLESDGTFRFEDLPLQSGEGTWHTNSAFLLLAQIEGFGECHLANLSTREPNHYARLILRPVPTVTGRVLGPEGAPVAGARIYPQFSVSAKGNAFPTQGTFFAETDASGLFETSLFYAGDATFGIAAPSHAPRYVTLAHVTPNLGDFSLSRGQTVTATLVRRDDAGLLPALTVSLWSRDPGYAQYAKSDDAGKVTFTHVPDGTYQLTTKDDHWVETEGDRKFVVEDVAVRDETVMVSEGARIAGRVFDKDTGHGIAHVAVRGLGGPVVYTDPNGDYVLTGLRAGKIIIQHSGAPGYPSYMNFTWEGRKEVDTTLGETVGGVDFPLSSGQTLSGRVVDEQGRPVAGARIHARQGGMNGMFDEVVSDGRGRFSFAGYEVTRDIRLFARTHNQASHLLGPLEQGADELEDLTLTLYDGAAVEGQVVDGLGAPLEAAGVMPRWHVDDETMPGNFPAQMDDKTQRDGHFRLYPLPPGDFHLWMLPPGTNLYLSETFARVQVAAGETHTGVNLVFDESGGLVLSGRVVDTTGKPLRDVSIQLYGPAHHMGQTKGDGRFRFSRMPAGEYRIAAGKQGFTGQSIDNVAAGGPAVEIVLEASASLSGRVVNGQTGAPLRAFEIAVSSEIHHDFDWSANRNFESIESPEGRFSKTAIGLGRNTVVVRAPGYVTNFAVTPEVSSAEAVPEFEIAMLPGRVAEGTVTGPDGMPVADALVFIGTAPGAPRYDWVKVADGKTEQDGTFHLDTVPADATQLTAWRMDLATGSARLLENHRVHITLNRDAALAGTVTQGGLPFEKAPLHIMFPDDNEAQAQGAETDTHGVYSMTQLPAGTGLVRATQKLGPEMFHERMAFKEVFISEEGTTVVDFDFFESETTVSGHVLYNDAPLPYLGVSLKATTSDTIHWSYGVPVAPDGSYVIYDVPPGMAELSLIRMVEANGYSSSRAKGAFEIREGEAVIRDVLLEGPEAVDTAGMNDYRAATAALWEVWTAK